MDIVGRTAARSAARRPVPQIIAPAGPAHASAEDGVTALYHAHALGLIRLAHIMLGDRAAAEDVIQDAFCGLYRNWSRLADQAKALPYVRSSVLNGCRSALRRRRPVARLTRRAEPADSLRRRWPAEATAPSGERRRGDDRAAPARPAARGAGPALLPRPGGHRHRQGHGHQQEHRPPTAYRALAALGRSLGGSK
jgi:hypothetical protein